MLVTWVAPWPWALQAGSGPWTSHGRLGRLWTPWAPSASGRLVPGALASAEVGALLKATRRLEDLLVGDEAPGIPRAEGAGAEQARTEGPAATEGPRCHAAACVSRAVAHARSGHRLACDHRRINGVWYLMSPGPGVLTPPCRSRLPPIRKPSATIRFYEPRGMRQPADGRGAVRCGALRPFCLLGREAQKLMLLTNPTYLDERVQAVPALEPPPH